jgi:acyl-ACP thioesterase
MAGAYQAVVMLTTGFATRTRSRAPEGAASTQVVAVVNMGIREPQDLRPVNAINRGGVPGEVPDALGPWCGEGAGGSSERCALDGRVARVATPDAPTRKPNGGDALLPVPNAGRVFRAGRRVRLGDVDPIGRLRLDALARYLQDVSGDDTDDSRLPDAQDWVVRRTVIEQHRRVSLGERLELATFCSGYGSRWAERRVSILGEVGGVVDAVTVWVHVDPATGRPKPLSAEFHALYDTAAGGREVLARQVHDPVDPDGEDVLTFPWQPRATDLDVLDHANNAMGWAVLEQLRARLLDAAGAARGDADDPLAGAFRAEIEFREAVERPVADGEVPLVVAHVAADAGHLLTLWSADRSTVHLTASVQPLGDSTRP